MNETMIQEEELEIDLLEVLHVLLKKWWLILIGAICGAGIMMLITSFLLTPKYESQAMLYILNKTTSVTSIADIQIGSAVSTDFEVIAKSKPVIDNAIAALKKDEGKTFTRNDILDRLSVSNLEDTRILLISVTAEDPTEACIIANAVAQATSAQMAEIMKSDPPTMVEKAEVSQKAVSPSMVKNVLIGFVGAAFLVCAILVVRFLMNDNLKTEEDIMKYLGAPTLATIPYVTDKERKRAEQLKQHKEDSHAK